MKIRIYPKSLLETMWQQDKLLFTPEAEQPPLCLRCGQPLDCRLVINALSRYADVHICEAFPFIEFLQRLQKHSILNDIHKRQSVQDHFL